jgi:signal transduction histidine kinase/ligand-binding sensor domain-containing protein
MWFGTWNGLNRYDGYKFKVFKHEPGNPKSLSGVYVYSLFKDHSGDLWVGTDGFLDRFDPETESFTHYKLGKAGTNRLASIVAHVSEDSTGKLWLSTQNGLFRLDSKTGELKNYIHNPTDPSTLADSEIKSTGEDREGNFWVATSRTLDEFDRHTGKVKRHIQVGESGIGLQFHEDRLGIFWVIYGSPGYIGTLDRKTGRLTRYEYDWKTGPARENQAYSLLEDSDGNMWFGTGAAGLMKFDRRNRCFISYQHDRDDAETISGNHVITLFEDREENIWAGLHQEEPNYFPIRPLTFENLTRLAHARNGEVSGLVSAIYEDGRDKVWLGVNRRLYRLDRKTREIWPFEGVDNSEVYSIIPDGPDVLWFGNAYPGLLRYNAITGERSGYRHDPNDPTTLCSGVTAHLLVDAKGTLWAATWDGLCQLNSSTNRFTKYTPAPGSRGLNYYAIGQAPDGALWLGGNLGLHRFDPQTKTFTVYSHDAEDPSSISDNHVNAVFFDRLGTLWAGTQNGLDKFNPAARTFKAYDQRHGLSGAVVSCILEDDHGTLWMSTNAGISSFNKKTEHFSNYTTADGIPGPDLTGTGACSKSSRGEMLFAGFNGATAFFPDKVIESRDAPHPVLTDFRLFGSSVVPGGRRSPLRVAINRASTIQLSHLENIFAIEFSALAYLNPGTNRYRYKLDGIDKGWREVGSDERLASYTTLPAGSYTFRLEAATTRGPWSPDAVLEIKILPPFWQTYWFLTFCVAVLGGILGLLYRIRLNQLAAQFNMRIEERVGERTRIARELHDTLLQSFQGLMLRFQAVHELLQDGKPKQLLQQTLKRADQALDEGRSAVYDLRSAMPTNDFAQAVQSLGSELGTDGIVAFRLAVEGRTRAFHPIIRDELYRITREALRNAFHHAHAHQVEVEITYLERLFRLRIRDDGKGIPPEVLKQGRPGHYGLNGMRERAEQIGARFDIWSGAAGAGTEIELTILGSIAYGKSTNRLRFWPFRQKVG